MNRKQLLSSSLSEQKNVDTVIATTLKKDVKAINKAKRDLQDQLEEAEEQLEERLSSDTPLDKSVVEVTYSRIKDLKAALSLYESFEKEYLPTNSPD